MGILLHTVSDNMRKKNNCVCVFNWILFYCKHNIIFMQWEFVPAKILQDGIKFTGTTIDKQTNKLSEYIFIE